MTADQTIPQRYACLLCGLLLAGNAAAEVEVYGIDKTHSFANWSIRHVVAKTSGTFSDVRGKIVIDRADLGKSSVEARINVRSLNSNHALRDQNVLDKAEYLDAPRFGEMRFVSSRVEVLAADRGLLHGQLTLHGVTRDIVMPFRLLGFGPDPWGGQRMGAEAQLTLKAGDYGFGWVKPGAPVGDEIEVTLLIEGVKNSPDFKPW